MLGISKLTWDKLGLHLNFNLNGLFSDLSGLFTTYKA
jgi:hypothetical protein